MKKRIRIEININTSIASGRICGTHGDDRLLSRKYRFLTTRKKMIIRVDCEKNLIITTKCVKCSTRATVADAERSVLIACFVWKYLSGFFATCMFSLSRLTKARMRIRELNFSGSADPECLHFDSNFRISLLNAKVDKLISWYSFKTFSSKKYTKEKSCWQKDLRERSSLCNVSHPWRRTLHNINN